MLKPIVKEDGVNDSERELGAVSESTFLSLWSFPCVYTSEGLAKKGIGVELIDLVVYFDNTLILFSDKNIAFQEGNDLAVAWPRWHKKSVIKSAGQLHGAEKAIRERPKEIFLDKKCTQPFPYDLSSPELKIHLVAVTYNSSGPAKKYFASLGAGDSSSGSLMSSFRLPLDKVLKSPFVVNDIDPCKTFVHVLGIESLRLLLSELMTIKDFVSYLESKEEAIRERSLAIVAGEEDLLGHYLFETSGQGYGKIEIPVSGADMIVPEGEWASFNDSLEGLAHRARKAQSRPWNAILRTFSDSVSGALVGEGAHLPLSMHEQAVRSLASENLFARASLAKALMDKYDSVPVNIRSSRLVYSPGNADRLYVFLMYPRNTEDYAAYREERYACMQLYALVAMYQHPKAKEIVVLGADCKGSVGSSETLIVVDGSVPLTAEGRRDAIKVMRHHNILNEMLTPVRQPPAFYTEQKISRNEPCPCNSGKKYKKCCLR